MPGLLNQYMADINKVNITTIKNNTKHNTIVQNLLTYETNKN